MQPNARPRRSIPKPYRTGVQLLALYNQDVSSGNFTEKQLIAIYGRRPWFVIHPYAAPAFGAFIVAIRDVLGRGYNFPDTDPNEVHVCLPKADYKRTDNRPVELPVPGEMIVFQDGRQVIVESIDLGGRKLPNTAILHVQWLF
jgi:hypothetical protein